MLRRSIVLGALTALFQPRATAWQANATQAEYDAFAALAAAWNPFATKFNDGVFDVAAWSKVRRAFKNTGGCA